MRLTILRASLIGSTLFLLTAALAAQPVPVPGFENVPGLDLSLPSLPELPEVTFQQEPGDPEGIPPALRVLIHFLGLTEEQVTEFVTLREEFGSQVGVRQAELDGLQQALKEQLESGEPSESAVGNIVIEMHELGHEIAELHQGYVSSFVGLLDEEQKERMQLVRIARHLAPILPAFAQLSLIPPLHPLHPGR